MKSKSTFNQSKIEKSSMNGVAGVGWTRTTLGELGKLRNGINFNRHQEGHGLPVLKVKDFGDRFFAPESGYDELDPKTTRVFENQLLQEGDTVIIRSNGNSELVGRSLYFPGARNPVTFSGFCIRFRPEPSIIHPRFAAYLIRSPFFRQRFSAFGSGTGIQNLSQEILASVPVSLPPITEQRAIANILGSLDDKIKLNQQTHKTLEEIGKAIFKHWFIDFEFPNEEGKPYKSSGGEMVYSKELGKDVPRGHKVGKLGEFIDLDKGLSYKGAFLSDEGIPMINLGTMARNSGFIIKGLKHYVGEYKEKQLVKAGDIVIANTDITQEREVLGSPAIIPPYLESDSALFTHHIFAVRNKSRLSNLFIYHLLMLNEYKDRVKGFATGTTVLALPKDAILDFNFVVPDEKSLVKFNTHCSLLFEKANLCIIQNRSLTRVLDSLLPKLTSGKIRVQVKVE